MRRDLFFAAAALVPVLLASIGAGAPPKEALAPPTSPAKPVTDRYFDVVGDRRLPLARGRERPGRQDVERGPERLRPVRARRAARRRRPARTGALHRRVPRLRVLVDRPEGLDALRDQEPAAQAAAVPGGPPLARGSGRRACLVDPNAIDPKGGTAIDFFVPSSTASSSPSRSRRAAARPEASTSTRRRPAGRSPTSSRASTAAPPAATSRGTATARASSTRATRAPASARPRTSTSTSRCTSTLGTPTEARHLRARQGLPAHRRDHARGLATTARFVLAAVKNGDGGERSQYLRAPRRHAGRSSPPTRTGSTADASAPTAPLFLLLAQRRAARPHPAPRRPGRRASRRRA